MKRFLIAARSFSLPASLVPVLFGTVLAVVYGAAAFDFGSFMLAMLAMASIHSGANMLNDCFDFKLGLDRSVSPGSGAVVRGLIKPGTALLAAIALFCLGAGIGIYLALKISLAIMVLGIIGLSAAIFYSCGPRPLKHYAWGDATVFISFGILGALGGWIVQTGSAAVMPALWSTPIAMLIVAILHANNWRDSESDGSRGVTTVASKFGGKSVYYYLALLFAPYLLIVLFIVLPRLLNPFYAMPWIFLITAFSLPKAFGLAKRAIYFHRFPDSHPIHDLDARTAQLNLVFGLLAVLAGVLDAAIR